MPKKKTVPKQKKSEQKIIFIIASAVILGIVSILAFYYKNMILHSQLVGKEWIAFKYKIDGNNFVELTRDSHPKFYFTLAADGKITGYDGCNSFFGNYEIVSNTIQVKNLGTTLVDCEDVPLSSKVGFFLTMPFSISNHELTFSDAVSENVLMVSTADLRNAAPAAPKVVQYTPAPTLFFARPQTQQLSKSNWKTVTDDRLGVSVWYPADLEVIKKDFDYGPYLGIETNSTEVGTGKINGNGYYSFSVYKESILPGENLQEWIVKNSQYEMMGQRSFLHSQLQPYKLGNYSGYSVREGVEIEAFGIYVQKGNTVYHFILRGLDAGSSFEDNPKALNIFLNMMETVEFTD